MVFWFQTEEKVYFVLASFEEMNCFNICVNINNSLEKKVKFYSSIIDLSLEYFHKKGIVYRDIKQENILLERDDHLKLIDFEWQKYIEKI